MAYVRLETFSQRLLALRRKKGWSTADLARESKVGAGTISAVENDKTTNPRLKTAAKLAKSLSVSLDYLDGKIDDELDLEDAISMQALRIFLARKKPEVAVQNRLMEIAYDRAGPDTPERWERLVNWVFPEQPPGKTLKFPKRA